MNNFKPVKIWNLGEAEASACRLGPCRRGGRGWRISKEEEEQEEDEGEKKDADDDE